MINIKPKFIFITVFGLIIGFMFGNYFIKPKIFIHNYNVRSDFEEPALEPLVNLLKIYNITDKNRPIKLIRLGKANDGGYVVPVVALQKATALLGYGISNDISFEEQFSNRYQKESYGFDCTITSINIKNKLCHFIPECIATHTHSKLNFSSFSQHLKTLRLNNTPVFVKMDIEGAEYDAFIDILKHTKNITGIVLELHFANSLNEYNQAIKLLSKLNQNFFLIHVHGNNCCGAKFKTKNSKGYIPKVLELTYINKSLANEAKLSINQSHPTKMDLPNCPGLDWAFEILK
jgi:hypothetical protein